MRVLLCHNFYGSAAPSGENGVFRNERDMLQRNAVEVIPYERFSDDIDLSGLGKRISLGLETAWSTKTYSDVVALIRRTRPDVAHFHNTFPLISPSAYAACKDNGVPVVQTLHNYRLICPGAMLARAGRPCEDCVGKSLLPALRHRCYRSSLPATAAVVGMLTFNRYRGSYDHLVDRYIALTQFAADRLIAGGLPPDKIVVKPNFLWDVPLAKPAAREESAVFVGRLSQEKGVWTLLRAWRQLPFLPLKVFGDGPLRAELEHIARKEHLNIQFMGYRSHEKVLEAVSAASLQVVPSEWYEGFPMVVLEAYACGTPVVGSDLGSLSEVIVDRQTGLLFTPGDPDDLACKVKLLSSSGRLLDFGRAARKLYESYYTPTQNISMLIQIYHEALSVRLQYRPNKI